ncbi:hypothetical protein D6D21_07493 [Aureobasidium pullulans]|uniref:Rhodopsin domain-containing protein n=1 Tax=Aureobasidium pullulans TaxID=5580 RepID=A0AB74IRU3_AURPU|nr:hypothetical protein D6D21_07493 [Aureobasidium pullulans]
MFLILTTLCVFLRLWAKLRTGKRVLGVDDYSMLTAWIRWFRDGWNADGKAPVWLLSLDTASNVEIIVLSHSHAVFRDSTEKPSILLQPGCACIYTVRLTLGEATFMLATIFLKISLMLFYRQFVWKKWQRRAIIIAGAGSILLSLIALFLSLFQCGSLSHIAHRQIRGQCVRRNRYVPLLYLHGATGAVTDWAFALLPVSVLIKSSLKPHIKLSVCILLILGVTGSVAACFRTAFVYGVWFDVSFLDPAQNPTFYDYSAPEIVLALTELGFGISAASLACLQPLLRHFIHKLQEWFQRFLSSDSDNTTGAVRSYMGLLPHVQLRGKRPSDAKETAQAQAGDANPRPEFPPHPAVRRYGMADAGGRRGMSLARPRSSPGVPTLQSISETTCEHEHPKPVRLRKPSMIIGVLPTISTEIDHEEESGPSRVADTPTRDTFEIEDPGHIKRVDSQGCTLH